TLTHADALQRTSNWLWKWPVWLLCDKQLDLDFLIFQWNINIGIQITHIMPAAAAFSTLFAGLAIRFIRRTGRIGAARIIIISSILIARFSSFSRLFRRTLWWFLRDRLLVGLLVVLGSLHNCLLSLKASSS